jgi:hypothetical protein
MTIIEINSNAARGGDTFLPFTSFWLVGWLGDYLTDIEVDSTIIMV